MIKLPELAEQAKFIADWHGADWSSALCQDKDGNQAHEIICESREESVISTGNNSNESSWLCDYLEMCSPENIIAIAKYVAELEQRLNATAQPVSAPEWTNEQCLEFLSIAFRHANISGDIEMDDIRMGIRMVNASGSEGQ
ncbi:hypothetical protein [Pantoea ananatis]|uniref:hypothetical protein n=1 Tax=Pantoea ananas TaxID=553 RepID=UPI0023AEA3F1|nr:hypothetical protein [Pantoea ananatis]